MSDQNKPQAQPAPKPVAAPVDQAAAILELAKAIVEGNQRQTEALIAAQPKRIKTVDEVEEITSFNPTGAKNRKVPFNAVYQNGTRLFEHLLHDEELHLLKYLKPGRFLGDYVVVTEMKHDGLVDMHIDYKSSTPSDRLECAARWRGFTDLLKKLADEGAEQDARRNDK